MKTISGLLAILLGVVGFIACLVGGAGVWWAAFEVAEKANTFTKQAEESLGLVNDAFSRIDGKVDLAKTSVERVRMTAAFIAAGKSEDDPKIQMQVTRLLDTLTPHLDRAEALADPLQSLATILRRFAGTLARLDDGDRQAAQFRSIADALDFTLTSLGTVRSRYEAIREGEGVPRAAELVAIAEQAQAPIDRMQKGLSELQGSISEVREELPEVREAVRVWKIAGPIVVNVLLFWIALGQLCLIGWGRRRIASQPTP